MDKEQVAAVLTEIGTLLELKGENPFKTRAYQNAARTLESLPEPLEKLVAEQRLGELKGFGDALVDKITQLVTTGNLPYYDELKASVAPGLIEMLGIPSLGPKKVKKLHDELGVDTIEALEAACKAGKVAVLDGFGEKTQTKILEGIAFKRQFASKHHLHKALAVATPILESLRQHPDVTRCSTAGSLRRWKETIGDIDFLVSSRQPAEVIEFFVTQPGVLSVSAKGDTKASVIVEGGIQADLRVVSDAEYPFALAYFTGSKEHNIVMRQRAIARGLRLNEYGPIVNAETVKSPYGHTRRLIADAPMKGDEKKQAGAAHGYVTPSKSSPKDVQGRPLQEDVWKYLFTSDVDVTGKPVPAEAGVKMDQRSEAKPKKK